MKALMALAIAPAIALLLLEELVLVLQLGHVTVEPIRLVVGEVDALMAVNLLLLDAPLTVKDVVADTAVCVPNCTTIDAPFQALQLVVHMGLAGNELGSAVMVTTLFETVAEKPLPLMALWMALAALLTLIGPEKGLIDELMMFVPATKMPVIWPPKLSDWGFVTVKVAVAATGLVELLVVFPVNSGIV